MQQKIGNKRVIKIGIGLLLVFFAGFAVYKNYHIMIYDIIVNAGNVKYEDGMRWVRCDSSIMLCEYDCDAPSEVWLQRDYPGTCTDF
jgi:hypothetical protein